MSIIRCELSPIHSQPNVFEQIIQLVFVAPESQHRRLVPRRVSLQATKLDPAIRALLILADPLLRMFPPTVY